LPKILENEKRNVILGVANVWEHRKGLNEFIKLNDYIDKDKFLIVLIGLTTNQINQLPSNMVGLQRTENLDKLVALYNRALVFVNPSLSDTLPTTNLEAIACGTPVITYNTGGSVEVITPHTGFVVEKHDVANLYNRIKEINQKSKEYYQKKCVFFAE